jgi:subtilisin family serine protease
MFTLAAAPSAAFLNNQFLTPTLPLLRAEAERVRATMRIEDNALAHDLIAGLVAIALLQNRRADAIKLIAEARTTSAKPRQRVFDLLHYEIVAATDRRRGSRDCAAGAALIGRRLDGAEPALARSEAISRLSQYETTSTALMAGIVKASIDPVAATQGGVTLLQGLDLARRRATAAFLPPCRTTIADLLRAWLSDPRHASTEIWTAREPAAADLERATPVTVAIWDSGYDPSLFPGQLAIDPAEPLDGRDNDGNGVIDDWNGPTFDYHLRPLAAPLPPPSPLLAGQLDLQMMLRKGNADMELGLGTAEATIMAQRARESDIDQQANDDLLWSEVGIRTHGTKLASEIADGAPFVRLYNVFALPFGYDPRPVPLDEAQIGRWVTTIDQLGVRMRRAGVRIANLSWGISAEEIAQNLLAVGDETDRMRAIVRGKALFSQADAALRRMIAASPDILFVTGAGNSNQADVVLAASPQSIVAPNLVVIGAATADGRMTDFSTFGDGVSLYAWGEGVPSRTPGGGHAHGTGTSEAAPLVVRAAAQMLAANPRLSASQLAQGLRASATTENDGVRLLHAADAVRWAKSR